MTLRLAVAAPSSLDPRDLDTADSLLLASYVFDGLVAYDPSTFAPIPAAAERWEVLEGGRRFVFHLRRGATFHDGSPVRAQDFVTAWNRLADPVAARPYAFLLEQVKGFAEYRERRRVASISGLVARDERTLEVALLRPWPDFVALLGHPALSPVPTSAERQAFGSQPAGNGPYRLVSPLGPGLPLVLQRFDGYHGTTPQVSTLEVRSFETPEEVWPELVAGELDVSPVPVPLLAEAESRFGDQGLGIVARLLYCGVNEAHPRFGSDRLRLAVSLAVDRGVVASDVYAGGAEPATAIVPPTVPGHRGDVCADRCGRDLQRARGLVTTVPPKARRFALDYPRSPVADQLAATLAGQLGEAGLRVTPRPHDEAAFGKLLDEGGHQMFCLVWAADYPRAQALLEPLLESGSKDNHGRVADEDLDALLVQARTAGGASAGTDIYVEAERLALRRMHVIPMVWFRSHLAVQPYVRGFALDPMGRYDAASLSVAA